MDINAVFDLRADKCEHIGIDFRRRLPSISAMVGCIHVGTP